MKSFILLFSLLLATNVLLAQNPGIEGGEVEVIKDFDARLLDTEKLTVAPGLPALDTTTIRQTYRLQPRTLTIDYLPPKIRPLAMKGDDLLPSYNGYAKLGAGFPNSFFADVSYDIFAQEQFDIGVDFRHHSANNSKKVENQRFMENTAGVQGNYYMKSGLAVGGGVRYTVDDNYLYGYNFDNPTPPEMEIDRERVLQRYSTVDVNAKVFNGERTAGDLNYSAGFDFYYLTDGDLDVARERGFDLKLNGTKWFGGVHPLSVTLRTDFTNYEVNEEQTLNNFYFQPNFTYHADAFKVKLGLNLASHEDEYFFFPDVEAMANVLGSALSAFVGAKGDLYKNNFRNTTNYNPYIVARYDLKNANYTNFYGGVKGNVQGIEYRAEVGYKRAKDLALYLTTTENFIDPLDEFNRFDVLYDTVGIVNIGGTVSANIIPGLELVGTLGTNIYSPENESKAWHLPTVEINVTAKYLTLEDKLQLKGQLFIENGVPYINSEGLEDNLNGLLDVSIGAEYTFSKNFGAFVDIYNLANNKRERWYRYPTYGINVLGGIVAKF